VRQEGSYRLKLSLFEVVGCVPTHHLSFSLSLHIHPSPSPPMCLLSFSCFTFVTNPISLTTTSAVPFRFSRFVPFRSVPLGVLFHFIASYFSFHVPSYFLMILNLMIFSRSNVYHCKSIFSAPFYVYTAKKFPGMEGLALHIS
jgi:hypothetical protein